MASRQSKSSSNGSGRCCIFRSCLGPCCCCGKKNSRSEYHDEPFDQVQVEASYKVYPYSYSDTPSSASGTSKSNEVGGLRLDHRPIDDSDSRLPTETQYFHATQWQIQEPSVRIVESLEEEEDEPPEKPPRVVTEVEADAIDSDNEELVSPEVIEVMGKYQTKELNKDGSRLYSEIRDWILETEKQKRTMPPQAWIYTKFLE